MTAGRADSAMPDRAATPTPCRRDVLLGACALSLAALSGCATAPTPDVPPAAQRSWSGRLSLQIEREPPQAFYATFTLTGTPKQGRLDLSNPLGSTVAQIRWRPGLAELQQAEVVRQFDDLDDLLTAATGANLPLPTLFDWLDGRATPAPGWEPDLSQYAAGRISARRVQPLPVARLQVVLDRAP